MAELARLLSPRSIAAIGGRQAAEVVRQCRRIGFAGPIWRVHPRLEPIEGAIACRSVEELPEAPDAAFVAVNRHQTVEVVAALAARGAGGAVCYAAGFAEAGAEGAALQAALVAAAGAMPVIGPNCYGLISYLDGVALWPDQHGGVRLERGVAIVTQSGNIGLNLTMQRRAVPIACLVTLGNQAAVGIPEVVEALAQDPRISAIGLHIEGIADPAAFTRAAALARRRGIPVVAIKTGRSAEGARLTVSHTASLAGRDEVVEAFLRRAGVVRVHSIPALLESLKLLHILGPLPGTDIASMSCSGGEAALVADAVAGTGLSFRPLSPAQAAAVAATLPELVTISNPLDYHTFSWANPTALAATFGAMLAAGFAITLLILDFPRADRCDARDWRLTLAGLVAAVRAQGGRAGVVATLAECLPEADAAALAAQGIVPLYGIDEALAAIAAAAEAGRRLQAPEPTAVTATPAALGTPRSLSEWEGKRRLAAHGVTVPEGRLVRAGADAGAAAEAVGFPVALKAVGAAIAHKTEIGAVRLGLKDAAAVRRTADALGGMGEALLVERMVEGAVAELIIGVDRDPAFGPCLVIGSGGILVELVGDSRLLLMPATRAEIEAALDGLKIARLLDGYRGRPAGSRAAAIDAILGIQDYALAEAGRLIELDVNPLMVTPTGAVAADVLIREIADEGA